MHTVRCIQPNDWSAMNFGLLGISGQELWRQAFKVVDLQNDNHLTAMEATRIHLFIHKWMRDMNYQYVL